MFALDGGIHSGLGDEWLRIGGTKIFSDGSLIGRTAAMFDPFEGGGVGECSCGFFQTEPEVLRRLIIDAHKSGWQVCTHAIGDRAVATVLDAYEEAQKLYHGTTRDIGSSIVASCRSTSSTRSKHSG